MRLRVVVGEGEAGADTAATSVVQAGSGGKQRSVEKSASCAATRPPGRVSRRASATSRSGIPAVLAMEPHVDEVEGRRRATRSHRRRRGRSGRSPARRSAASATKASSKSSPVTLPSPTRALSAAVIPPGPQPRSRQRQPSPTPMPVEQRLGLGGEHRALQREPLHLALASSDAVEAARGRCVSHGVPRATQHTPVGQGNRRRRDATAGSPPLGGLAALDSADRIPDASRCRSERGKGA